MGERGPLPKPAALRLLEGNAGKRPLDLSAGVNPPIKIPSPPKHLGLGAKKEWKRITPLLYDLGLIAEIDRESLEMYCQAVGRLSELETAFNGQVHRLMQQEGCDYSDAVYRASCAVTPSGYVQQSVLVQLIRDHRNQVNRFLGHFGGSPALRGRVQASNYVQPTLPGIDPKPEAPRSGFSKFQVV